MIVPSSKSVKKAGVGMCSYYWAHAAGGMLHAVSEEFKQTELERRGDSQDELRLCRGMQRSNALKGVFGVLSMVLKGHREVHCLEKAPSVVDLLRSAGLKRATPRHVMYYMCMGRPPALRRWKQSPAFSSAFDLEGVEEEGERGEERNENDGQSMFSV